MTRKILADFNINLELFETEVARNRLYDDTSHNSLSILAPVFWFEF